MIKTISHLYNFGVFYDFVWSNEINNKIFKKFNLLYGWNRSGKTTLSRVFASCEKKSIFDIDSFKQYPENGKFELITSDNTVINEKNVTTNDLLVKVFNQDFVDDNISFEPSDSCNPIIYVSEEDIESKKHLEKLKLDNITLLKTHKNAIKDKSAIEETKNTFLSGLGREIANILFDKSYNKTKVENKINTIGVDNFADKTLSDKDKIKYEKISKSEAGKTQTTFSEYAFSFSFDDHIIDSFQKIFERIDILLGKKVLSETLDRLKDDQILNNWVKQGFDLHKTKEEKENCLFCQKPLEIDFLSTLSKHFSKDYEDLQSAIKSLISEIIKIKRHEIATENNDLYPDLKEIYTIKAKELNEVIVKINTWIDEATKFLQEKYDYPLVVVVNPIKPEDFLSAYNNTIKELNKIINEHNEKTNNHPREVSIAREKLELNSIATALKGQNFKKMGTDLEEALKNEKEALNAVNKNNSEIAEIEKYTSNIGKAIIAINKHLEEFFGRKEIELSLDRDNKGYTIKRDGKPANNLSEGEKTAIAFSYFVVKVGEGDFDKSKGIIFIDDPISSFDSNFIYHCFSMIKNHFTGVGQLFISTHNFQLFNLIKDWFHGKNKGKSESDKCCEFFMVDNFIDSDIRKAKIIELHKTLQNYKSEYHFLYAKLKNFSDSADMEYEDFYTIGNMARRFFDIFVDFKIPKSIDQKSKMNLLIEHINNSAEIISVDEAEKVYKLINEFSHNYDPTSIIEHKDKSESKNAIKTLLKIVEKSDPNHFNLLKESLA
jgi:wobble nucleotide-excising tRNase